MVKAHIGSEPLWTLNELKTFLEYTVFEDIGDAVERAKTTARHSGMPLESHFITGDKFEDYPEELYITKYAALLITLNADTNKPKVALAQHYFALHTNEQALKDEKRLRARYNVREYNKALTRAALAAGVVNFAKFQDAGLTALYGGLHMNDILKRKGLPEDSNLLDHIDTEELVTNLFRITQTKAALDRQAIPSELTATRSHERIGHATRKAVEATLNPMPEDLPPAKERIDRLVTETRKRQLKKPDAEKEQLPLAAPTAPKRRP
jgi:DNA-damage-inducible protein D